MINIGRKNRGLMATLKITDHHAFYIFKGDLRPAQSISKGGDRSFSRREVTRNDDDLIKKFLIQQRFNEFSMGQMRGVESAAKKSYFRESRCQTTSSSLSVPLSLEEQL